MNRHPLEGEGLLRHSKENNLLGNFFLRINGINYPTPLLDPRWDPRVLVNDYFQNTPVSFPLTALRDIHTGFCHFYFDYGRFSVIKNIIHYKVKAYAGAEPIWTTLDLTNQPIDTIVLHPLLGPRRINKVLGEHLIFQGVDLSGYRIDANLFFTDNLS